MAIPSVLVGLIIVSSLATFSAQFLITSFIESLSAPHTHPIIEAHPETPSAQPLLAQNHTAPATQPPATPIIVTAIPKARPVYNSVRPVQQPYRYTHRRSSNPTPPIAPEPRTKPSVPPPSSIAIAPRTRRIPPANISGQERYSRERITKWIGGEAKLREMEGDLWEAKTAAREALRAKDINMDRLDAIAIIDFTKPSYLHRMSLYHPRTGLESRHLVSHGVNSGNVYANQLSNRSGSHQSSPGLYWVGTQYSGKHGRSIKLHGMENGKNDNAYGRAIVMHQAYYVSYNTLTQNLDKEGTPRLGRSHGCPAVHVSDMPRMLEQLKEGTYMYIHTR